MVYPREVSLQSSHYHLLSNTTQHGGVSIEVIEEVNEVTHPKEIKSLYLTEGIVQNKLT